MYTIILDFVLPLYLLLYIQQPPLLQVLRNLLDTILHALLVAPDVDLSSLRRLVGRANACKLWYFALASLLVQSFRVSCLGDLKREVDEDLHKGEGFVVAGGYGV